MDENLSGQKFVRIPWYPHSLPGVCCGLPATNHNHTTRRFINIKGLSHLQPWAFLTRMCALITWRSMLYRLSRWATVSLNLPTNTSILFFNLSLFSVDSTLQDKYLYHNLRQSALRQNKSTEPQGGQEASDQPRPAQPLCHLPWVVSDCNALPEEVVCSPSTNVFKNRLDKHWMNYAFIAPQ